RRARTPWASCSRSDGSAVHPFGPDLPEVVPLPSRLVQPAEGELHALADGDVALGAVGALEVDTPAAVAVDDRHGHGGLGDRREVVDGEGEHGAALREALLGEATARLAPDADQRLRVLHQPARLAPAAVEPDVLLQLLPLEVGRHRLAGDVGGQHTTG